jgi:hypothetical protein
MVAVRNVQGLVLAGIPVMYRLQPDPFGILRTGDRVRPSPARGVVESPEKVDNLEKEVRR